MSSLARPARDRAPIERLEGREKVTGAAPVRLRAPAGGRRLRLARRRRRSPAARSRAVDADGGARALPGVLAVLSHDNAPRLGDADDARAARCCSPPRSHYRGQIVARRRGRDARGAPARPPSSSASTTTQRAARRRAARRPPASCTRPSKVNPTSRPTPSEGDVEAALAGAGGARSTRPTRRRREHNNPMEPHATVAVWERRRLTLYDSTQGVAPRSRTRSRRLFGLDPERVRVHRAARRRRLRLEGHAARRTTCWPRLAAQAVGRPVKLAADPAADVRARRLPHADHPARPARRRRRRPAARDRPRRRRADLDASRSSPSRPRWPPG